VAKIYASCSNHAEKLEPSKVLPYEITPKLIRAGFSRRAFLAPLGLIEHELWTTNTPW